MKQQENSPAWKGSPRLPELAILKAGAIILFRHDVGKRKEEVRDLLRRGMENRLSGKPLLEVESVRSFSLRGVNSYILNVVKGDEREGILAAEYIIKEGNRILNVVKGD
ncbi:MAG: hypothetical protein H5T72_00210, partial [Actinobacteria bacterium]|nr:hypothetical protein [Actinomycetota bacterium]